MTQFRITTAEARGGYIGYICEERGLWWGWNFMFGAHVFKTLEEADKRLSEYIQKYPLGKVVREYSTTTEGT